MKRYYACHCAWARESILSDDVDVSADFCHCSGGFTKQPWEAALDQPLEYEMVKSVLKGDDECSFVIQLPEDVE
jgi:predicted hydrocarbon binding protein